LDQLHDHHVRTWNEHALVTAMERITTTLDDEQIDEPEHLTNMQICQFRKLRKPRAVS